MLAALVGALAALVRTLVALVGAGVCCDAGLVRGPANSKYYISKPPSRHFHHRRCAMRCPYCHVDNDRVLDTRATEEGYTIRRKRLCHHCHRRFITLENVERLSVRVVKREHSREPFDREKVRRGIERACSKRPITSTQIERTVQDIEADIYGSFESEIPASQIGEIVMHHLAKLDEVAYIRFSSVYREFDNARDFMDVISHITGSNSDQDKAR